MNPECKKILYQPLTSGSVQLTVWESIDGIWWVT